MSRRRSPAPIRLIILGLALVVLIVVVARSMSLAAVPDAPAITTPTLEPIATFDAQEVDRTIVPVTDEAGSNRETPADEWANAVLDAALPLIGQSPGGLAAWGSNTMRGSLRWDSELVLLGGDVLDIPDQIVIEIAVIDGSSTSAIAQASPDGGALRLTVNDTSGKSWLLSNASPLVALKALAIQAAEREITLRAAYVEVPRSAAEVVLLEADGGETLVETVTPIPTGGSVLPTATRLFDPALGDLIGKYLRPAITEVIGLDPSVRQAFMDRHSWTGILAASETEIRIGGRLIPIESATELNFYLLEEVDQSENVVRLFTAVFTAQGTTRFPDDQVFFQAHRLKEVLYWAASLAAEEDGQLVVAFDDNGSRQSVTIIGFRPFGN